MLHTYAVYLEVRKPHSNIIGHSLTKKYSKDKINILYFYFY